ncbi:MAG: hypothetical protein FJ278_17965, partial [Planctomycetes bacterium]|nr:hypothetical protein [Planctomycetota bacterium]
GEPARIFGQTKLDPTSDKVKALFVRIVDELAEQTAANACVPGIGISIDGFFTLTDETGYGANTLRRYERDTGGKTPSAAAEAYDWLHATPERLKHWQAWRCAEMRELLTRLRDAVRKRRPNLVLKVALMNKRTYEFLRMTDAEALDLLLGQGIDPALYRDDDGIFFAARSCYEHKPKNKDGTAGFNFTHGVADVPTRHGTGYHQWTGYWEQAGVFNCLSRYQIGWLASANLVPLGRRILETATYHLRVGNVRELQYQTWERGLAGWEHHLRRFAAAFRALPVAEPRPFKSKVAVLSGPPADETLWVSWHGDRLAVINDHAAPRVVRIEAAGGMVELGRSRKLRPSDGWIELELAPFDLLVLAAEKSAPK